MAKKYSDLESAGALTGTELLAVSQRDSDSVWQSKKITLNNIKDLIPVNSDPVSVDGITDTDGDIILSPPFTLLVQYADLTITPESRNVRDVSYYISIDNATVTFDLSNFSNEEMHPRYSLRIVCRSNSGGYLTFSVANTNMYRLNGTSGRPETITLTRDLCIYDVILTWGGMPALIKVYGA